MSTDGPVTDDEAASIAIELASKGADRLRLAGLRADYSERSLGSVDRLIAGSRVSISVNAVAELGCYAGETIRRKLGGSWVAEDHPSRDGSELAVILPAGTTCFPITRVRTCVRDLDSSEVGVWTWFGALRAAEAESGRPPRARRRRWSWR